MVLLTAGHPCIAVAEPCKAGKYCVTGFSANRGQGIRPTPTEADASPNVSWSLSDPQSCQEWDGLSGEQLSSPRECGVLWYVHVTKTGGDTVKYHLQKLAASQSWPFFDLYMPSSPLMLRRPRRWEKTKQWSGLMTALNESRPRAVVHMHDGFGGMGEEYLEQVVRPLAKRFEAEQSPCRVALTTVLREPVSRHFSHVKVDNDVTQASYDAFTRASSSFTIKYLLFTTDWRDPRLFAGDAALDARLLEAARTMLSHFELVGRMEQLGDYLRALEAHMGWPGLPMLSKHASHGGPGLGHKWPITEQQRASARYAQRLDTELYQDFCGDANHTARRPPMHSFVSERAGEAPGERRRGVKHVSVRYESSSACAANMGWQI